MRRVAALLIPILYGGVPSEREQRIEPEVIVEGRFRGAEGLAFNAEGRLFMAANRAVWEVTADGATRKVADFTSNLGLAPIGPRDILKADFGPLVFPQAGPNSDGVVWRLTPEGETTRIAEGIGDPNAIVVLPDGALLVSDDFTPNIYRVNLDGEVSVFTDAIPFPNGLALAPDGSALYVAQIFSRGPADPPPARFEHFSDQVWRLPLHDSKPAGTPEVIFRTGGETGPDGLAIDTAGRLYLSAARAGQLWRIDPATGQGALLADGLPGLASLAFGRGAFDHHSLYAAQIKGGRLLRFRVGIGGQPELYETSAGGPALPSTACAGDAYRRLEFWLGEWTVSSGGRRAGTNSIRRILGGCAIEEHWTSASGQRGRSLFYHLPALDEWRQVWVTGNPAAVGGVKEKREIGRGAAAIFQGEVSLADGRRYLDRTTLAPLPDGTVRQRIDVSTDGGATWRVSFDGLYRRPEGSRRVD